jgi:hypothetical protein
MMKQTARSRRKAASVVSSVPFTMEEPPFDPRTALVDALARNLTQEILERDPDNIGGLDVPVRPLNVVFSKPADREPKRLLKAFLHGDTHHGYQDDRTLAVTQALLEDFGTDILIDMGDGVDAGHLSAKFPHNPVGRNYLQDEINAKRMQLASFRRSAPNAEYWYLEGNHEERLRRAMWNAEGPQRALMQLDVVQRELTWPKLLDLDPLHIKWVGSDEQTSTKILPKFITKHGTRVSAKSGYTATLELNKYNRSGASGHTHRLGAVWKRDHNGQHLWIETGTGASLNPDYTQDPDWQNGCVMLTFEPETGAVTAEPVEIRNGHTIWRDKEYRA